MGQAAHPSLPSLGALGSLLCCHTPKTLPKEQDRFAKSHFHPSSVWGAGGQWFSRFVWFKYPEPKIGRGLKQFGLVPGAAALCFPLSPGIKLGAGQDGTARDKELTLHSPCHIWGLCLRVLVLALSSSKCHGLGFS